MSVSLVFLERFTTHRGDLMVRNSQNFSPCEFKLESLSIDIYHYCADSSMPQLNQVLVGQRNDHTCEYLFSLIKIIIIIIKVAIRIDHVEMNSIS